MALTHINQGLRFLHLISYMSVRDDYTNIVIITIHFNLFLPISYF